MAGSSSGSSDDDLWASDEDKENLAERTRVGRWGAKSDAERHSERISPTVAALAARAAGKAESERELRQKHERLLRVHRAQTDELQAAREELHQLRYAHPRLQRELEV